MEDNEQNKLDRIALVLKKLGLSILPHLKNKYVVASILFFFWIMFFDRYNVFTHLELQNQKKQLEKDRAYYKEEIIKVRQDLKELTTNEITLEKFAREKYLMKRDNEDIFITVEED